MGEVVKAVGEHLFEGEHSLDHVYGKGCWAVCYGGHPLNEDAPDVAVLVERLKRRFCMHLVAVQADKVESEGQGVGKHVDAVYYYPTEYLNDGSTVAWGGCDNQRVVGTTRILLEVSPLSGLPLYWIAAGGGDITNDELRAAWEQKLAILSVPAKARFPQDPNLPDGPCRQFWESLTDYEHDVARSFRRKKST